MKKVAVLAATGKVGSKILDELLARVITQQRLWEIKSIKMTKLE